MLSAICCHLPCLFRHTSFLRLNPNATSALEPKMVHNDPKPPLPRQMETGLLDFVVPGKAQGKRYGIQSGNKSTYL